MCVCVRVCAWWVGYQLWQDYQLHWEPSEFGGITVIRVKSSKVWKPDIVLFNKLVVIIISTFLSVSSRLIGGGSTGAAPNEKCGPSAPSPILAQPP